MGQLWSKIKLRQEALGMFVCVWVKNCCNKISHFMDSQCQVSLHRGMSNTPNKTVFSNETLVFNCSEEFLEISHGRDFLENMKPFNVSCKINQWAKFQSQSYCFMVAVCTAYLVLYSICEDFPGIIFRHLKKSIL